MSFAKNFALGQQIAQNAINAYRDAEALAAKEQAGKVYKDATMERTNTESNFGEVDPNAVFQGDGGDGTMTNAEAASFGLYTPTEDKEAGTGTTRQYGLGMDPAKWQDKQFTPNQKRAAGLRAQMDFYDGRGDADMANKLRTQLDAADDADFQAGQRTRKLDEQGRGDKVREGLAKVDSNVTETRSWADILRDQAKVYQANGDNENFMKFTLEADKMAFKDGAKRFNAWSAKSGDMPLGQAAAELARVFNTDGTPGSVKGIRQNDDGSITVGFQPEPGGSITPITVKSVAELKQAGFAHYNPDNWAKIQEKKAEVMNDPSKRFVKFSSNQTVLDGATGQVVQRGVKAGGTPIYDEDGNITGYSGGGGGEGDPKKKKGKSDIELATSSVMDAVKESAESKSLNADQLIGVQATARQLVSNAASRNQKLDPYVAGKVALTAVLKPESVKPSYNAATGAFESTVAYNGNTFSVGPIDPTTLPESQLKGVAKSFTDKLPAADRSEYIKAASGDKATIDKINKDTATYVNSKEWADQFRASAGRAPTAQDRADKIAQVQSVINQNINLVRASGVVEQAKNADKKAADAKTQAQAQAAIGTPDQIMALPRGEAQRIYNQYNQYTNARQREALQMKMTQDRRNSMTVGGLRQQ